jgi:hypothetical protein
MSHLSETHQDDQSEELPVINEPHVCHYSEENMKLKDRVLQLTQALEQALKAGAKAKQERQQQTQQLS